MERKSHWQNIYHTKDSKQVSWYTPHLAESLRLILSLNLSKEDPMIDVGSGASTLVDDLLKEGFNHITVLDISSQALEVAKKRLGEKAQKVKWVISDITTAALPKTYYTLWHDRAVFHFLTKEEDRQKYKEHLRQSLKPGGYFIVSTFSPEGPPQCSGLEVQRYSPDTLGSELGKDFLLMKSFKESHHTPFQTVQDFTYCLFRKFSS